MDEMKCLGAFTILREWILTEYQVRAIPENYLFALVKLLVRLRLRLKTQDEEFDLTTPHSRFQGL